MHTRADGGSPAGVCRSSVFHRGEALHAEHLHEHGGYAMLPFDAVGERPSPADQHGSDAMPQLRREPGGPRAAGVDTTSNFS